MKSIIIKNLGASCLAMVSLLLASCNEGVIESQPDFGSSVVITALPEYSATSAGAEYTFKLSSSVPWDLAVTMDSADENWCRVSPESSDDSALVTDVKITIDSFESLVAREATVTITGDGVEAQTIKITQLSMASLEVTPVDESEIFLYTAGDSKSFEVMSNRDWTVASDQDWCTFNTSGEPSSTEAYTVTITMGEENPAAKRYATVTVTTPTDSREFIVAQESGVATPALALDGEIDETPFDASEPVNKMFNIASTLEWTAAPAVGSEWLSIVSSVPAMKDGSIEVSTVLNNATLGARKGSIIVSPVDGSTGLSDVEIPVTQESRFTPENVDNTEFFDDGSAKLSVSTEANTRIYSNYEAGLGTYTWTVSECTITSTSTIVWFLFPQGTEGGSANFRMQLSPNPASNILVTGGGFAWSNTSIVWDYDMTNLKEIKLEQIDLGNDKMEFRVSINGNVVLSKADRTNAYSVYDSFKGLLVYFGPYKDVNTDGSEYIIFDSYSYDPAN